MVSLFCNFLMRLIAQDFFLVLSKVEILNQKYINCIYLCYSTLSVQFYSISISCFISTLCQISTYLTIYFMLQYKVDFNLNRTGNNNDNPSILKLGNNFVKYI